MNLSTLKFANAFLKSHISVWLYTSRKRKLTEQSNICNYKKISRLLKISILTSHLSRQILYLYLLVETLKFILTIVLRHPWLRLVVYSVRKRRRQVSPHFNLELLISQLKEVVTTVNHLWFPCQIFSLKSTK